MPEEIESPETPGDGRDPEVVKQLRKVIRPVAGRKAKVDSIMNEDLIGIPTRCTVCTRPIPDEMAKRRAVVCSDACREVLGRLRRKHRDDRVCRYCSKPSTTSQRRRYRRFQKWELDHPHLAYADVFNAVSARGIQPEVFAAAVREARDQDYSLELNPLAEEWTRFPKDKPHANLDQVREALRAYWAERQTA